MSQQRHKTIVLLSGVLCVLAELRGEHQRLLTETKNNQSGKSGFNKMLALSIVQLGDKTTVTEEDVERMLSFDRKKALLELRQFSLDYQEKFEFDYEWAMDAKGRKDRQHYEVAFTKEDFPSTPYHWVVEALEKGAAGEDQELPILFESYQEVLAKKSYDVVLPRSGKRVRMDLLDGLAENKARDLKVDSQSSHSPLLLRFPRFVEEDEESGKERVFALTIKDLDRLVLADIEHLRIEYKKREGFLDTTLVIRNQKEESKEKRVDLIAIPDFFFPSTASS